MNSSKRYSDYPIPTRALLSIKPCFAYAILRGEKKYEFRRSIFTRRVDVILLYACAPVGQVLAEFDVRSIISDPVQSLWNRTKSFAGIGEEYFFKYFHGKKYGHAIEIGEVRPFETPFCPIRTLGIRPPQSFVYLRSNSHHPNDYVLDGAFSNARSDSLDSPGNGKLPFLSGRAAGRKKSMGREDFS